MPQRLDTREAAVAPQTPKQTGLLSFLKVKPKNTSPKQPQGAPASSSSSGADPQAAAALSSGIAARRTQSKAASVSPDSSVMTQGSQTNPIYAQSQQVSARPIRLVSAAALSLLWCAILLKALQAFAPNTKLADDLHVVCLGDLPSIGAPFVTEKSIFPPGFK